MVEAFGDVHMLSHLVGASNRADIRRLSALEEERRALTEELAAAREQLSAKDAQAHRIVERHAAEVRELENRAKRARAAEQRLAEAEARLRAFERGDAWRELRARNDELVSSLEKSERAMGAEVCRTSELEVEVAELRRTRDVMTTRIRELSAECDALEMMLRAGVPGTRDRGVEPPPSLDLRGRRIAYVGGRPGLTGHFRALIEQSNGELIHHDGGIDDSGRRLARILGQADAVLCPIDCVSHGACLRAKQFCKRTAKPFVPLRTAGLSSLVAALREVSAGGAPESAVG